jgi:hypothetical protein
LFDVVLHVLLQPAKLACIEYPREPSKDEAYAWVCLYKAVWVADSVLGMRAQVGDESCKSGRQCEGCWAPQLPAHSSLSMHA